MAGSVYQFKYILVSIKVLHPSTASQKLGNCDTPAKLRSTTFCFISVLAAMSIERRVTL